MEAKRSGLLVLWDMIVAPRAAFDQIDARPRWLAAYLVVCVLGIAGALLQIPVQTHVGQATLTHEIAHDPRYASMSPKQIDNIKSVTTTVQRYLWIGYPIISFVGFSIAAALLFVGARIGRSATSFSRCFALAANTGIISWGLFYLLLGVLCALHSPAEFDTQSEMVRILPSAAWLVPAAGPKLTVALAAINPLSLWSLVLLALGLRSLAKVGLGLAYGTAALIVFGGLLFAVPFAK